ncbi:MAG: response regulator [candidate division Zixibacteria bacterium]|nr:response regulator [candidate division Zixibacteria bacterium]
MMVNVMPQVLIALVTALVVTFLTYRLRFFAGEDVQGRFPFLFGGILVVLAAVWQILTNLPAYAEWFVGSAYVYLDIIHLVLLVLGVLLLAVGLALYSDFWQTRREDIDVREQKLSILSNLHRDSRQPYQLLELLDLSLKEVVAGVPESSGAMFLINRARRQFVLTTSAGLTRQEIAALEYYPLERNIVSQAVDMAEPLIAGSFDFVDRSGGVSASRFSSCLVLPMISGMEPIGGIILFSEKPHYFGKAEIKYLAPVAEWLAEKIRSARWGRDLTAAKKEIKQREQDQTDFSSRLVTAATAFSSSDALSSFCRSLVGLGAAQSAHLVGMVKGALHFFGGSEPLLNLSENYRTALIDAIDRNKPLIVNQEAAGEGGRTFIAVSTLVYPFGGGDSQNALILRRESFPFKVSETELKTIEIFTRMADLVLQQAAGRRLDVTRRRGFDKILELLRFDGEVSFERQPQLLAEHLSGTLPEQARTFVFVRQPDALYASVGGLPAGRREPVEIEILPGEGEVGRISESPTNHFTVGRQNVAKKLGAYEAKNREAFYRALGEDLVPGFLAVCPITRRGDVLGAIVVFMSELSDSEAGEWEKLLTLAVGLYSVRLTIDRLHSEKTAVAPGPAASETIGAAVNRLNNYLSVVVGSAELAKERPDISGDVRAHFQSIIDEAEQAARFLKESFGAAAPATRVESAPAVTDIDRIIGEALTRNRISDNLYMVDGRTREIVLRFGSAGQVRLSSESIANLAREAVSYFSSIAEETDIISVSTYARNDYAYLDISRHRKNFPPVEKVAGFGQYENTADVLKYRPSDAFLTHVSGSGSLYSFDRYSQAPSYLSFKFPLRASAAPTAAPAVRKRILAIDDQSVILDLITAMGQSLGYEVQTASSGERGLELAAGTAFDVVLTDLAMPGMSGMEVARRIKRLHPQTPIVLVTGWEVDVERTQLAASGISEVLYKPFRIEQLTDILKSVSPSRTLS